MRDHHGDQASPWLMCHACGAKPPPATEKLVQAERCVPGSGPSHEAPAGALWCYACAHEQGVCMMCGASRSDARGPRAGKETEK